MQQSLAIRPAIGVFVAFLAVVLGACAPSAPSGTVVLPSTTLVDSTTVPQSSGETVVSDDGTVIVDPGMDLESLVSDAPIGTAFKLQAGVHRGYQLEPKDDMSFDGVPGTVMNGAEILSGFVVDGDLWRLDGVAEQGRDHGDCVDGYEACQFTRDLFVDDLMLWQVADLDDIEPGSWYRDGTVVYMADDPTNRRIELSTTSYAFVGDADGVTITGLAVEKYATPAQEGTIQSQLPGEGSVGSGWTVTNVEVSGNHGAGIRSGDSMVIRDSFVHDNGQLGITAAGITDLLIEGTEISHNNIAGFAWEWEAGGVKVTNSSGIVFRDNHVHHNAGPGLWADIDNLDTLYESNNVTDNVGPGIFHEISGSAVVRWNTVERNGLAETVWLWGAGILVAASSDVEVYENTVSDNGNAIAGIQQDRGDGRYGARVLVDLNVHDNTIRLGDGRIGIVEDVGDDAVFFDRNNRFQANTYVGDTGSSYMWDDRRHNKSGWMAQGQDTEGTWR